MSTAAADITMNDAFPAPAAGLAEASKHTYPCPEISAAARVRIGIQRVLEEDPGGRGFLQEHGLRLDPSLRWSNCFTSLRGDRRTAMLEDVCDGLVRAVEGTGVDSFSHLPELGNYVC